MDIPLQAVPGPFTQQTGPAGHLLQAHISRYLLLMQHIHHECMLFDTRVFPARRRFHAPSVVHLDTSASLHEAPAAPPRYQQDEYDTNRLYSHPHGRSHPGTRSAHGHGGWVASTTYARPGTSATHTPPKPAGKHRR